ncbi:MAG: CHAT domain-containing protein, partial [Bacteroidota bacterium]
MYKLALQYKEDGYEAWLGLALTTIGKDKAATEHAFYQFLTHRPSSLNDAYTKLAIETIEKTGAKIPPGVDSDSFVEEETEVFVFEEDGMSYAYSIPNPTNIPLGEIRKVLRQYLLTPEWIHAYFMVEDKPVLRSRPASVLLGLEVRALRNSPAYGLAFERSEALKQSSESRPERVFAEKLGYSVQELRSISFGIEKVQPIVKEILDAPTLEEKNQLIRQHIDFFTTNNTHGFLGFFRAKQQDANIQNVINELIWIMYGVQHFPLDELLFRVEDEYEDALLGFNGQYNQMLLRGNYDELDTLIADMHTFLEKDELSGRIKLLIEAYTTLARIYELKIGVHSRGDLFPKAMEVIGAALELSKRGTRLYAEAVMTLATILNEISKWNGKSDQEDDAQKALMETLKFVPLRTAEYAAICNLLGVYFRKKAKYGEGHKYLSEARFFMQQAIENEMDHSHGAARSNNNLGNIYNDLFELTGRISYQDQAIASFQSSLDMQDAGTGLHENVFNGLAISLSQRGEIFKSPDVLENSIEYYQKVLANTGSGENPISRSHMHSYNNLGLTHIRLHRISKTVDSLQKALHYSQVAYDYAKDQSFFEASIWQQNHAYALVLAYQLTKKQGFLHKANEIIIAIDRNYNTKNLNFFYYAAIANHEIFQINGEKDFLAIAFNRMKFCLENIISHQAYMMLPQPFLYFVDLIHQYPAYLEAHQQLIRDAVKGFESLVKNQSTYDHKKVYIDLYNAFLEKTFPLFVQLGLFEELIHLIESSISNIFSAGADFSVLNTFALQSDIQPDQLKMFHSVNEGLWQSKRLLEHGNLSVREKGELQDKLLELEKQRTSFISSITSVAGKEEFGQTISFTDLLALSNIHPILYCISNAQGGLLIFLDQEKWETISLPELTDQHIDELLSAFYAYAAKTAKGEMNNWLAKTGRWIGETVFSPVFEKLKGQEVYLITVGKVGLLPIQIATVVDQDQEHILIEHVRLKRISSGSQIKNLWRLKKEEELSSILFVDNPESLQGGALEYADLEVGFIQEHFQHASRLSGTSATQQDLRTKVHYANILHMACHSFADLDDPLKSG